MRPPRWRKRFCGGAAGAHSGDQSRAAACRGRVLHRLHAAGDSAGRAAITAGEALATRRCSCSTSARGVDRDELRAARRRRAGAVARSAASSTACRWRSSWRRSQVAAFGIRGLARAAGRPFRAAEQGPSHGIARQQTLRATLDWSYDLLPPIERIVLRRLAVFRWRLHHGSGAARSSATSRISGVEVVDSIANLATKSLVTTDISGDRTYHRLLDTTRAYALEKLAESGAMTTLAHAARRVLPRSLRSRPKASARSRPASRMVGDLRPAHRQCARRARLGVFRARRRADRRGADRRRGAAVDPAVAAGRVPRAGRTRARQPGQRCGRRLRARACSSPRHLAGR